MGYERGTKPDHNGAKNDGGFHGTRAPKPKVETLRRSGPRGQSTTKDLEDLVWEKEAGTGGRSDR